MKRILIIFLMILVSVSYVSGQTLFAVTRDQRLVEIDATDGTEIREIATGITTGNFQPFGMAVDPTSNANGAGEAYITFSFNPPVLHVINLSTGAIGPPGIRTAYIRGLAFDSTGQLWGVTGDKFGSTITHNLITIDKTNDDDTLQNSMDGYERLKLAIDATTDTGYILAQEDMTWLLFSFDVSDPNTLTEIPLSGDSLDLSERNPPGFVYDEQNDILITQHNMDTELGNDFATINPVTGVVTTINLNVPIARSSFDFGNVEQQSTEISDAWLFE